METAPGHVVYFRYVMRRADGSELDTSGATPFAHLLGSHAVVPGLERALLGRRAGEHFDILVPPVDGYGERDGEPPVEVPRTELSRDFELEAGTVILLNDDAGEPEPVWVVRADAKTVMLDRNHPLAGESLAFSVDIVSVRESTEDERATQAVRWSEQ